jgi:CRISPR-associated Csx2 family protein
MATVLVSFIGKGNFENNAYEETDYHFQGETVPRKTAVFGSALRVHLIAKGKQVERWLIMGTKESIWAELIKMSDNPDSFNENSTRKFLEDESLKYAINNDYISEVSQEEFQAKLNEWQQILTEAITGTKIICCLVGDATEPVSQNLIFQSLLDVIKDDNKVDFDVTHGLRNQPIITSFVLMYLQHLRKIKIEDITFHYGAFDSRKKTGEVHTLNFCNELLKATEAVAIFEQTGNYEQIGEQVSSDKSFADNLKQVIFSEEMHRSNKVIADEVIKDIPNSQEPLLKSLSEKLQTALSWSDNEKLSSRLYEKAEKLFEKGDYFKATASLFESILVANCENNNVDVNNHEQRDKAKRNLKKYYSFQPEVSKFEILSDLRNAVLHGSDAKHQETKDALVIFTKFEEVFENGKAIYTEVKTNISIGKI